MRIAILADIHGNADALEAVIADLVRHAPDLVVNLGDCCSGPLDAARSADRLIDLAWPTVRGNHDRYLIEQPLAAMGPSDSAAARQLGEQQLAWLRSLPPTATIEGDVFLCHATPAADDVYWTERVEPDGVVRAATETELEAHRGEQSARLILCGHTHVPRIFRLATGQLIVNPGSVGAPGYTDDVPVPHVVEAGSPDARYALADRVAGGWRIAFQCVPYDPSRAAGLARAAGRPEWERALRTGLVRQRG